MGICSAFIHFNSGASRMLEILELLDLEHGYYTLNFYGKKDSTRIQKIKRKITVEGKLDRKYKRAKRKNFQDRNNDMYLTGGF